MSAFNLEAYLGKWYQIASIPAFYNEDCRFSTASYWSGKDGIRVKNSCFDSQGSLIRKIYGNLDTARGEGSFCVSFGGIEREYIVIQTNYTGYALVGSSDYNALFVLSRLPYIKEKRYLKLVEIAKALGYFTCCLRIDLPLTR